MHIYGMTVLALLPALLFVGEANADTTSSVSTTGTSVPASSTSSPAASSSTTPATTSSAPSSPGTTQPAAPTGPCKCCNGKYCSTSVSVVDPNAPKDFFHLSWTISGDSISFGVSMKRHAWIGLGLSASGDMEEGYAVIGASPTVRFSSGVYILNAMNLPAVLDGHQVPMPVSNFTFTQNSLFGLETRMSFTRKLTIADTNNENANIDLGSKVGLILAAGLQQSVAGSYSDGPHGQQHAAVSIDLRNGGDVTQVVSEQQVWVIGLHATCMLVGWVVLIPLGIMMARIKHHAEKSWFLLHRIFQMVGFLLGITGFIIIAVSKSLNKDAHFDGPHGRIGLAVTIIAIGQPIGGLARPHAPGKGEKKTFKRSLFEIFHHGFGYICTILAIVNVFIALKFLPFPQAHFPNVARALEVVVFVYVGALLLIGLVGTITKAKQEWMPFTEERRSLKGTGDDEAI